MTAPSPPAHGAVESTLAEYRRLVAAAVGEYLPDAEPRRWLYDLMATYPARAGKGLRAALCIATCRAFGGTVEDALPTAIAIELLHNAFLIHDDVEDGSEQRRGRPTLHEQFGVPLAVNAGDGLAVAALTPLRKNLTTLGPRLAEQVATEVDTLMRRTIEGQAIELGWRADNVVDLTATNYLEMIFLKTCAYTTIHPLRTGALIGSWGTADLDPLTRFGFHLGASFQIRDDVLNLVAPDPGYGKERSGDLYEGKRTLMIIHLLAAAAEPERTFVERFLAKTRTERTDDDVAHIHDLLHHHGSIEYAHRFAEGVADAAHRAFDTAFARTPDTEDLQFIASLIPYVVTRTR